MIQTKIDIIKKNSLNLFFFIENLCTVQIWPGWNQYRNVGNKNKNLVAISLSYKSIWSKPQINITFHAGVTLPQKKKIIGKISWEKRQLTIKEKKRKGKSLLWCLKLAEKKTHNHNINIRTASSKCLLSALLNWFQLVYGPFGRNNMPIN